MAIFVLPAWLFDGCANRDPSHYLGDNCQLIAPWSSAPLTFDYRNRTNRGLERYQLRDITNFKMSDRVFTGNTGEEFFIVQRSSGSKTIFATEVERDAVLNRDFATSASDLREKPWYSRIRANLFFPYNQIYYFVVTGIIASIGLARRLRRSPSNKVMEREA